MNFQKLGEVELLKEVPKDANLFVEYEGKVKRAPAKLGGSNFASFDLLPLLMNMGTGSGNPMIECSLEEAYSYINKVKESDGVILYMNIPEDMISSDLPISFIKAQVPMILGGAAKDEASGEVMMEGVAGVMILGSSEILFVVMASPAEGVGMIGIISDF